VGRSVHLNGRVYDPFIARFISADPEIQDPTHSQSYNRYTYVWNNPTNLTDPTGFLTTQQVTQALKDGTARFALADGTLVALQGSFDSDGNLSTLTVSLPAGDSSNKTQQAGQGTAGANGRTVTKNWSESDILKSTAAGIGNSITQTLAGIGDAVRDGGLTPAEKEGMTFGRTEWKPFGASDYFERQGEAIGDGYQTLLGGRAFGSGVADLAESSPQILLNKTAGDAARDGISAARPGSVIEQNFRVTGGLRRVDVLDGTTAIESKVGRTSLTGVVRQELARDVKMLRSGQVDSVEWHFTPSQVTGKAGPTAPLREKLEQLGITIVEHSK
jgi:hypothetical protein